MSSAVKSNSEDPLDLLLDDGMDNMGGLLLISDDIDMPEAKTTEFPMIKFEEESCSASDEEDSLTTTSLSFEPVALKPKTSGTSASKRKAKSWPRSAMADPAATSTDAKDSESSSSGGDGEDDVKDAKKQRRLVRNRMSAQLHRERKKAYVDQLEMQLKSKDAECTELRLLMDRLTRENDALRTRSGPHDGGASAPPAPAAVMRAEAAARLVTVGAPPKVKAASTMSLCSLTSAGSSSESESESDSATGVLDVGLSIELYGGEMMEPRALPSLSSAIKA